MFELAHLCILTPPPTFYVKMTLWCQQSIMFAPTNWRGGMRNLWTYTCLIKLMKGKALIKPRLHEKTAASVLLKPFISSNE